MIHEESAETDEIIEGLRDSEFIDVEVFNETERPNVLRQLEQYQFDSVFIFTEGFEERLQDGERRNLIEAYYTDRSFYYEPAKELTASLVQEQIGVYTTVDGVKALEESSGSETDISADDIVSERDRIERDTNLVEQVFYFQGEQVQTEDDNDFNPWMLWAYMTFIITIFIFDFVTRETSSSASSRFYFMKYSFTQFMLVTLILLTAFMLLMDMLTYFIISGFLEADILLISLLQYRIVINGIALFLACFIKSEMKLYQTAIALTVVMLALDLMTTFTEVSMLSMLHPVVRFTESNHNILWIVILLIIMFIWIRRGKHA